MPYTPRPSPLLALTLLAIFAAPLAAGPAAAQVNIDRRALDPLAPSTERPADKPPTRTTPQRGRTAQPPPAPPAPPPAPVARPEPPSIPAAPPPAPVIPPPIAVPARPPIAPSPVAVAPDAPGAASRLDGGGLRAVFGADRSDMNPDTEKAVRAFLRAIPAGATLTVIATAAGAPEDPSTPRRLALSRGLAVRSLAIAEGIVSTRIVVRAIGANPAASIAGAPDGPPDRADILLTLPPAPPAAPAASPAAPAPAPGRPAAPR